MRLHSMMIAAALTVMPAIAAQADGMKYYPYPSKVNYCPHGLQPISVGGVICCGKPNTYVTYRQMMQHPTPRRTYHQPATYSKVCAEGQKGC